MHNNQSTLREFSVSNDIEAVASGVQTPQDFCSRDSEAALAGRLVAEFLEMPGLCLTLPQTARLTGMDVVVARHVLASLVDTGFLRLTALGYLRA
jgi:hypothetical protein